MLRRLITILSGLSLVLCIATGAMWVRSYWVQEAIVWTGDSQELSAESTAGHVAVCIASYTSAGVHGFMYQSDASSGRGIADIADLRNAWRIAGVVWQGKTDMLSGTASFRLLLVPFWLIGALTLLLPTIWVRQRLKRRFNRTMNHCQVCGYDLRATPDRCPECGTETTKPANAAERG